MSSNLYVDEDGGKIVREGEAVDPMSDKSVVLFREVGDDYETSGLFYLRYDVFHAKYKRRYWECGVDLYSILHWTLDRARAAEFAEKIDTALHLAEEKKNEPS